MPAPILEFDIEESGYREGAPVVRGAKASLPPGEVALLAGPSGSGKTTLILSMTGVVKNLLNGYTKGFSVIAGINALDPREFPLVAREVGIVLQDPEKQIAMPTPLDEVSFTLENLGYSEEEALERSMAYLKAFGLEGKELVQVEDLSGGEKRRLTLAASLAHDPGVLILDEPTASVDPWGVRDIRRFVRDQARRGRAVIVVEHKARYFLDLASRAYGITGNGSLEPVGMDRAEETLENLGADASMTLEPRGAASVSRGETLLEAEGLVVGRGSFKASVEDVKIKRGEVVAIIGRNGSGKTTLLKTLSGLRRPLEGTVHLKGRAFYVPQAPDYLFTERSVGGELEGLDLPGDLVPRWITRVAGESPYRLSHGQRRWLSLLIAAGRRPDVLLLDEPTTGLDKRLFSRLASFLESARKSSAVIVATHDARLIALLADRVLLAGDGRVREIGVEEGVGILESAWR